jgi:hypothetical protein
LAFWWGAAAAMTFADGGDGSAGFALGLFVIDDRRRVVFTDQAACPLWMSEGSTI